MEKNIVRLHSPEAGGVRMLFRSSNNKNKKIDKVGSIKRKVTNAKNE